MPGDEAQNGPESFLFCFRLQIYSRAHGPSIERIVFPPCRGPISAPCTRVSVLLEQASDGKGGPDFLVGCV